jgi:pyruvate formate-lyase activating enzyme-like uncharacterized protein
MTHNEMPKDTADAKHDTSCSIKHIPIEIASCTCGIVRQGNKVFYNGTMVREYRKSSTMPKDTVEELKEKLLDKFDEIKFKETQSKIDGLKAIELEDKAIEEALTTAYNKGVEVGRVEEKNQQLIVMTMFVEEKGEKYPLGQYLDMQFALAKHLTPLPDDKI